MRPSYRLMAIRPSSTSNRASVMPGPPDAARRTGMPSRTDSQAASMSPLGLSRSASTSPRMTGGCGTSNVAASSVRHGVSRVQLKSVSPGL